MRFENTYDEVCNQSQLQRKNVNFNLKFKLNANNFSNCKQFPPWFAIVPNLSLHWKELVLLVALPTNFSGKQLPTPSTIQPGILPKR